MPITRRGSKHEDGASDVCSSDFTFESIKSLILESEARVMSKLTNIEAKISSIEARLDKVQMEQLNVSSEVDKLKDIILMQQKQIERMEINAREKVLIFSGVPESPVQMEGGSVLTDDVEKISYLCREICDFDSSPIEKCFRIGKNQSQRNRLLRVKFDEVGIRNSVLRSQRALREDQSISEKFGKIYINPDRTDLSRKEDKRLREKMKEIKASSSNPSDVFIRAGKLYVKSEIVDQSDIANQLF
jgi:hypothetical protein